MRVFILLISISMLTISVNAQELRTAEDIINKKHVELLFYRLKTNLFRTMVLSMPYGKATITEADRKIIKESQVVRVDLVYTDYPIGSDLTKLNLERINLIKGINPDLVSDDEVIWRVIKQTSCKNESEAKVLFHGVVLHYIPVQSEETIKADISWVGSFLPDEDSVKSFDKLAKRLPDTTVIAVLNRNKKWNEMHVIADLTGSMAPYVSQLAIWFKLNQMRQRVSSVTFFNDGDNKPQSAKIIGATGGIYHGKAEDYNQLKRLMSKTIRNGNGGDGPENDIEALISAIKKYPDAKEYILIADNMAPVKDYRLLASIDKPIRIVLCGTLFGINVQYLNLARETGGSIHTIEKDIEDLAKLKEGEIFFVGRKKFTVENGKIVVFKR